MPRLTVQDLIARLQAVPPEYQNAIVGLEGCDCSDTAQGVRLVENYVCFSTYDVIEHVVEICRYAAE